MARKPKNKDLAIGKHIHYWGNNYQVAWVSDIEVCLVVPGYSPNGWYRPYGTEFIKPTSVVVRKDNEFLMVFDTKRKLAGK
ncbi:hypothetical protein [Nostoc sp.]|uniref:hypothetical protein n=1 Tax=Nostoc sp. TaxID=1180 RepID=UPI002FF931BF